jgi:hypothetical protein
MWVRIGRWVEMGIHFGTGNRRLHVQNRYLVHVAVRLGKTEWYYGPHSLETSGNLSMVESASCTPHGEAYLDPEPLSWGIQKTRTVRVMHK